MGNSRASFGIGRAILAMTVIGFLAPAGAAAQDNFATPQVIAFGAGDYWSEKPRFLPEAPTLRVGGLSAVGGLSFIASPGPASDRDEIEADLPEALAGVDYLAGPAQPSRNGPWPGFGPANLSVTMAKIDQEIGCLALNIYFEARSESERGMLAVGKVVMNRVADSRFPDTVCRVVRQGGEMTLHRCQFSWWCDGQSDRPRNASSWRAAEALAREIYWNRVEDPSQGALWYHADYVAPYWRDAFKSGPQIGRHIFYVDKPAAPRLAARPQTASLR